MPISIYITAIQPKSQARQRVRTDGGGIGIPKHDNSLFQFYCRITGSQHITIRCKKIFIFEGKAVYSKWGGIVLICGNFHKVQVEQFPVILGKDFHRHRAHRCVPVPWHIPTDCVRHIYIDIFPDFSGDITKKGFGDDYIFKGIIPVNVGKQSGGDIGIICVRHLVHDIEISGLKFLCRTYQHGVRNRILLHQ